MRCKNRGQSSRESATEEVRLSTAKGKQQGLLLPASSLDTSFFVRRFLVKRHENLPFPHGFLSFARLPLSDPGRLASRPASLMDRRGEGAKKGLAPLAPEPF